MLAHYSVVILLFLTTVATVAGFIDTLAGGGGLLNLPALLFAGISPTFAFGTLRLQTIFAEFSASLHFFRYGEISFRPIGFALPIIFIAAASGTIALHYMPQLWLQKAIPFLLLLVFIWFLLMRLPQQELAKDDHTMSKKFACLSSPLIGFYNGFFGPGTGSIWMISLMSGLRWNLRLATMYAKPLNLVGNIGSLAVFLIIGKVAFIPGVCMAVGAFIGGRLGAHMVIYKGLKWLRIVFILLMLFAIMGTFYKYYYL